jgi:hypothetical protein
MDEFHLEYPMCVDILPGKGITRWGDFFGRLAVRAIPNAAAVDGQGTIVASGRVDDVLAQARESAGKRD